MAGVGVLRPLEHVGGAALLDDRALAHHVDAVGHPAHDAEIVRDQQHGHAELALQALQQLQDLRLDRHVERRGRLVGDQQVRLVGERHGDHDALALPARELMRKGVQALLGIVEADLAQQFDHARARGRFVEAMVQLHDLADLLLDACAAG